MEKEKLFIAIELGGDGWNGNEKEKTKAYKDLQQELCDFIKSKNKYVNANLKKVTVSVCKKVDGAYSLKFEERSMLVS